MMDLFLSEISTVCSYLFIRERTWLFDYDSKGVIALFEFRRLSDHILRCSLKCSLNTSVIRNLYLRTHEVARALSEL